MKEDQRQLAQTFDLYDADGTGHLDADELSELLASLGMESSGAQAAAMLTGMDHDGDGQVSRSEFLSFMATQAETSENDQSIEHTAKKVFALFDNDGSGSVAHSEFTEGLRRFGISMTEEEMTILVEELDHDRDGKHLAAGVQLHYLLRRPSTSASAHTTSRRPSVFSVAWRVTSTAPRSVLRALNPSAWPGGGGWVRALEGGHMRASGTKRSNARR